jgi:hypothetical protein
MVRPQVDVGVVVRASVDSARGNHRLVVVVALCPAPTRRITIPSYSIHTVVNPSKHLLRGVFGKRINSVDCTSGLSA